MALDASASPPLTTATLRQRRAPSRTTAGTAGRPPSGCGACRRESRRSPSLWRSRSPSSTPRRSLTRARPAATQPLRQLSTRAGRPARTVAGLVEGAEDRIELTKTPQVQAPSGKRRRKKNPDIAAKLPQAAGARVDLSTYLRMATSRLQACAEGLQPTPKCRKPGHRHGACRRPRAPATPPTTG